MKQSIRLAPKPPFSRYLPGLLFLVPALLVFGIFQWYPILSNFLIAFQEYSPGIESSWVGFNNFQAVLEDPRLPIAVANTFFYVAICLVFGYVIPILVAVALSELRRGRGVFRLAIYIPNIIPAIAVYIIWRWIFNPQAGLLNQALGIFGITPLNWIVDSSMVLPSLALMATWQNFGSTAVFYMASLTSVNTELYEAAELDGATMWQRIRHVTLPSISDTMKLMLVLQLIATFQVLQEPFVMTAGGPNDASLSVMLLTYQYAFQYVEFGKSGALGALTFIALLGLSAIYIVKSGLAKGTKE